MVSASALEAAIARPRVESRAAKPLYLLEESYLPPAAALPPPSSDLELGRPSTSSPQQQQGADPESGAAGAAGASEGLHVPPPLTNRGVQNLQRQLEGKLQVTDIGCIVHSIGEVNEADSTFSAEFTLFQRWRDPTVRKDPDMTSLRSGYRPKFANGQRLDRDAESGAWPEEVVKEIEPSLVAPSRPALAFPGALSCAPIDGSLQCYLSPNDEPGMVRSEERYRGIFPCRYIYTDFPYDTQALTLVVQLDRQRDAHRDFRQSKRAACSVPLAARRLQRAACSVPLAACRLQRAACSVAAARLQASNARTQRLRMLAAAHSLHPPPRPPPARACSSSRLLASSF